MRTILLVTVASVVLSSTMAESWAAAAKPRVNVSPDLQKNLEDDLQARQPKEFAFIARVIELIEAGTLGEPVVRSTFLWARKKPRRKFQYFERGLRYRATKMGIDLD
ncbi:MAG: hypothetical protein IIA67_05960 [Planctomycetes bacterium]|nr:hypothetical protein [Planctomycetota bacterium]